MSLKTMVDSATMSISVEGSDCGAYNLESIDGTGENILIELVSALNANIVLMVH